MAHDTASRITDAIRELQSRFLISGDPRDHQPLAYADVAQVAKCHPATVCRLVLAEPEVLLAGRPLADYFAGAVRGTRPGQRVSVVRAHALLADLCAELAEADDACLARWMRRQGVRISRRGITRWRAVLGIESFRTRGKS